MATYAIKRGDTLYHIAQRYATTVSAIEAVNPGIHPTRLRIGQFINLPGTPVPPPGTYLFQDEFNGAAGTPPDATKWVHDIGYGQWGNGEAETYTNSLANCFQDGNSNLVIRALKDASTQGGYTSARLLTAGKFSYYRGTWESRIKVPLANGTWPAWWCMGSNPSQWPQSGEVDILETYGANTYMETSVHLPDGSGGVQPMTNQKGIRYQDNPVDTGWHVYRMVWDANRAGDFIFSMDGTTYLTVTPGGKSNWCYAAGNPFYTLLNLAVGGSGGGNPSTTTFPVDLMIDYVRVSAQ